MVVDNYTHWYKQSLLKNEKFQQIRLLFDSVRDTDKKTVTIDYEKDGKSITFKVENRFNAYTDYLSSYYIVSTQERKAFKKLFEHEDIFYKHITAVYYRKQQLFPPLRETA